MIAIESLVETGSCCISARHSRRPLAGRYQRLMTAAISATPTLIAALN
jgi:hypothetical protein